MVSDGAAKRKLSCPPSRAVMREKVSLIRCSGVTTEVVRVPCCLGSAGVVVIVVGNYFDAAFNEASGASTCNHGFQHPRRNHCAPIGRADLTESEDHFPPCLAVHRGTNVK